MANRVRTSVVVLGLLGMAPPTGPALANGHFHGRRTTTYVQTVPTVYVAPASYVIPTTYLAPTTYVTSYDATPGYAYVRPTGFVETAFAAPLATYPTAYASVVPTSYYFPTTWYAPTVYSPTSAVYATSFEVPMVAMAAPDPCAVTQPAPQATQKKVPTPAMKPGPPPTSVESTSGEEPAAPTEKAKPGTVEEKRESLGTPPTGTGAAATTAEKDKTPPPPPAPEVTPSTNTGTQPAPLTEKNKPADPNQTIPPVAPEGSPNTHQPLIPPGDDEVRRQSLKPVMTGRSLKPYVRTTARGDLNLLEGVVKSLATGLPEGGVRVTVANQSKAFVERVVTSDDQGRYAVRLPDGEWTVSVWQAGQAYPVRGLTVVNGQIIDDLGRDIPTLTITR